MTLGSTQQTEAYGMCSNTVSFAESIVDVSRKDKLGKQLQKDLGPIMDAAAEQLLPGVMITVLEVKVTPDLGLAKVYLSFLNADDKKEALKKVQENTATVRHYLAQKLKDHVRKIPEVQFYLDETIDHAERIDALLKDLNKDDTDS